MLGPAIVVMEVVDDMLVVDGRGCIKLATKPRLHTSFKSYTTSHLVPVAGFSCLLVSVALISCLVVVGLISCLLFCWGLGKTCAITTVSDVCHDSFKFSFLSSLIKVATFPWPSRL